MLKIENVEVTGWEAAIRGMRNPMNSWELSDSTLCKGGDGFEDCRVSIIGECPRLDDDFSNNVFCIGENDFSLMMRLRNAGTDHRKFMRMITVYLDITAPLYWWKEFDTYKVGTVANSCSTMHKIAAKEFTLEDFSHEHLIDSFGEIWDIAAGDECRSTPLDILYTVINALNIYREKYIETKDKKYWWQMIQLLPTSYNQKRTVMLNYEVLANIYKSRLHHKLDEWRTFCDWVETLPYASLINAEIASSSTSGTRSATGWSIPYASLINAEIASTPREENGRE